ncbi:PAS domain-containing protein [Lacimicrobium alkaliphilum]|uniref:PAS domain-containing protein n=1 Tax=Lacimicrobium alkaliphilum TaxID=1526571 RepID=A0ABQ1QWZ9_9ALTE|nr:PAS domain-containing protein [Lacimicrobium alkaliphilum]GGD50410.1 hypothetical protein GCM10011357_02920 [Lacimicrobium alkaliphilum]
MFPVSSQLKVTLVCGPTDMRKAIDGLSNIVAYELEQQAQRLSTLLRSIIDASPDLIYYRNEEGRFAGCNRVAEQMTGKTEAELMWLLVCTKRTWLPVRRLWHLPPM